MKRYKVQAETYISSYPRSAISAANALILILAKHSDRKTITE